MTLIFAGAACSSGSDSNETRDAGTEAGPALDAGEPGEPAEPAEPSLCEDDDGSIPSCGSITGRAERQCDRATCERYVKRMKTRLARLAIRCMQQHIAAGDSCRPCSAQALAESCTDDNATAACESLVRTCPARSVDECVPLVSGLSFSGRLNFVTCATNDNCLHDLPSCLP